MPWAEARAAGVHSWWWWMVVAGAVMAAGRGEEVTAPDRPAGGLTGAQRFTRERNRDRMRCSGQAGL
jgi:hypothetical protein